MYDPNKVVENTKKLLESMTDKEFFSFFVECNPVILKEYPFSISYDIARSA